jgi:hypothetical protein
MTFFDLVAFNFPIAFNGPHRFHFGAARIPDKHCTREEQSPLLARATALLPAIP